MVLIVDDEQDICEILKYNLEREGYEVMTANSAEEAMPLVRQSLPELILLDVMMGEMSGFEMARRLKSQPETSGVPIIFITAMDSEEDTVKGLDLGGDDYIAKPLSMREVKARVKAVLRRNQVQPKEASSFTYQGIVLTSSSKTLSIDGQSVPITKIEYELLSLLLNNEGRVFSRDELLQHCWPCDTYVLDRTVDVNITRLRKKLGPYGRHIKTKFGFGYMFEP